jgi:hypothetical protein
MFMPSQAIAVSHYGQKILSPWCGGFNAIQPVEVDLNNDSKLDLVQFDYANFILKTFINIGNPGETKFAYSPKYEKNFPNRIVSYLILKDYNCDGIADLFHRSDTGLQVFRGYYDNNELKFTYYKSVYYPGANGQNNVYVQLGDIPAIVDMDKDGDLDMLAFDLQGVFLNYYKNMRVENNLPCDSIKFVFGERCWGKFYQSWWKTSFTNITCKGNEGNGENNNKQNRHAGNCILAMDVEGDGDNDLLDGVLVNNDIQVLYNGASSNGGNNLITTQDTTYNTNDSILKMPNWAVPSSLDIDHDGDQDLLFTSHADNASSANYNVCALYKNNGSNANPSFKYEHDTLFTNDMIDVGTYSYPAFFDYDKDGKLDLFIGTQGYLNNTTELFETKLAFYKNTSTTSQISFDLVSKDFLNLSNKLMTGLFPHFGDITGDGIDDLIIGDVTGNIAVYKNTASSNTIQANFIFQSDTLQNVKANQYSFPLVFDINADGKTDLLVGNNLGTLFYFQDTSTIQGVKSFQLIDTTFGNIKVGKPNQVFTFGMPCISVIDSTNTKYLFIGNTNGNIQQFQFNTNLNTMYSILDSNFNKIQTAPRSTLAIADLNQDGFYEMLVGSKLGGLSLYQQSIQYPASNSNELVENDELIVYPNPTKGELFFELGNTKLLNSLSIRITDLAGRLCLEKSIDMRTEKNIQLKDLTNGMYVLQAVIGKKVINKKIIKQ